MRHTLAALSLSTAILAQAFVPSSEDFENLNPTSSWDHKPFPGAIHDEPLGGDYSDPSGIKHHQKTHRIIQMVKDTSS